MLVFGPFRSMPKDESFIAFNLSSSTQVIPRLPGLFILPNMQGATSLEQREQMEWNFDTWYYDYVLNDPIACSSLMMILSALYEGKNVYICISEYSSDPIIAMLNESFMKLIQTRYDIKYSIINDPEDIMYIPKDGCEFASVMGIMNFDQDKNRFMQLGEEQRISSGGKFLGGV